MSNEYNSFKVVCEWEACVCVSGKVGWGGACMCLSVCLFLSVKVYIDQKVGNRKDDMKMLFSYIYLPPFQLHYAVPLISHADFAI